MDASPSPPPLLLVHGWALGPGLWRPLLTLLPGWPAHRLDLGFFGPPRLELPPGPFLAVGHSMGFAWLLRTLAEDPAADRRCQGLIALGGFPRFVQGEDYPHGVPLRMIQRMRQRLAHSPDAVLREFGQRSGFPLPLGLDAPPPPTRRLDALDQGLEQLAQWDHRPFLAAWNRPLALLAARDDLIVPPALTQSAFATLPAAALPLRDHPRH
ncbi:MAG: alpha/beta hydrolase, partial [Magnetococcales bacterium]|nr:alpha/beta hydrolase [Magnetococcales bacterium]